MNNQHNQYVIKKVKKVIVSGGHGGTWKIAYADFVTAMMTFFLLMWLISATPKENLAGVAQFFTPSTASRSDRGIGLEGGIDPNSEDGINAANKSSSALIYGASADDSLRNQDANKLTDAGKKQFMDIMNNIEKNIPKDLSDDIVMDITPEGLRIQIMDNANRPMFKINSDELEPYMKRVLTAIAGIIKEQPYHISITGHTASVKSQSNKDTPDYWKLSALRANSVRIFLGSYLESDQIIRILGKADKEPFDYKDPYSIKNIRTTITMLTNKQVDKSQRATPGLLRDE